MFLPIDITIIHLVTQEHYEPLKTSEQKQNQTPPIFHFLSFTLRGGGILLFHFPLSQSPSPSSLHSVAHPLPDQFNADSGVEVFLASVDTNHTIWEIHAGILYSVGEQKFLAFTSKAFI